MHDTRDAVGLNPPDLERELCGLPDVSAARIIADRLGRPQEVHVVALGRKHPTQTVRDVQSVALASFGLELDRRVISVAQPDSDGVERVPNAAPTGTTRPVIVGISAEESDLRALVRVTLARDHLDAVGFAEGSVAAVTRHRLVAAATLDALQELESSSDCLDIDNAEIVRVGTHDIAVVTVVFVTPPNEHVVSGSALVRENQEGEAVVRAVLDTTNRRLPAI